MPGRNRERPLGKGVVEHCPPTAAEATATRASETGGGSGEVTVNLFTLYVFDKVCGCYEESRPKLFNEGRTKTIRAYFDSGTHFNEWKRKPFLALLMYRQARACHPSNSRPRPDATHFSLPFNVAGLLPKIRERSEHEHR